MGRWGSKVKGTSLYATSFVGVNITSKFGDSLQNCQRKAREYNSGSEACFAGYGVHADILPTEMLLLTGNKDCDIKISGREGDHINMAKARDKALRKLTFWKELLICFSLVFHLWQRCT